MFKKNFYFIIFLFLVIFSFSVFAYTSVNCWDYDSTDQDTCEALGLCMWDDYGDWCYKKSCWDFESSATCLSAKNLSCSWQANTDEGWCEEQSCWSRYNETACNDNPSCYWESNWENDWCGERGCWDYTTESTCINQNVLDTSCTWKGSWCEENGSCWNYHLDETSCKANSLCFWENTSYINLGTYYSYSTCYKKSCWNYSTEADCEIGASELNMPCNWHSDDGWCSEIGCWNFDNNETGCGDAGGHYNFSCEWNDPWCYIKWGCSFYYSEKDCTDTYYCVWDDGSCTDPTGVNIEGDYMNPSCWIFNNNWTTCINVSGCSFDNTTNTCGGTPSDIGIRCVNISGRELCNDMSILSNCCTWENAECNATFGTTCYDNIDELPTSSGIEIEKCEDATSRVICNQIANDPWYMPCKWDNMSTSAETDDKCMFNNDDFDTEIGELGGEKLCKMAGGEYVCDCYTNFDGDSQSECTCIIETGTSTSDCDINCIACEYKADGTAWESSAAAQDACENSESNCIFTTGPYSPNTYGWCVYPTSVQYGYGDCSTDCYNCYDNATCSTSLKNCTWQLPMSSGWCESTDTANCWNIDSQYLCRNTVGCNWNTNYSYCEQIGCWSYFGDVLCNVGTSPSGFACSWDNFNGCEEQGCWINTQNATCENSTNVAYCEWDPFGPYCQERGCWDHWDEENCDSTTDYTNCTWQETSAADGWCEDTAMYQAKACSGTNCVYCFGQYECENAGCDWNSTYIEETTGTRVDICIEIGAEPEVCSNPGDEDQDGYSDCADTDCVDDPACGYGFGGDYSGGATGMNSSINCPTYDFTYEQTCITCNGTCVSGSCYWHAVSGATNYTPINATWGNYTDGYICDPVYEQTMAVGMGSGAPTKLGTDNLGEIKVEEQEWLDIAEVGIHDMPDNLDIGISLRNITNFSGCIKFYVDTSANMTGKFYRFLDTDGNSTGGCTAKDEWGGQLIGFDYKIYYMKNSTSEVKRVYKCQSGNWQVTTATLSIMNEGCTYTDPFSSTTDWLGVNILLIQKQDIGNPTNDLRIFVSTANETSNETIPIDSAGPFYYTPGSYDFKFEDCSKPGVDIDGDGFTSDQDPDCSMMKTYGYIVMEEGVQCSDGVDNDGDGDVDCNDNNCKYNSMYCSTYSFTNPDTNDNTAPSITWFEISEFPTGAFVMYDTDEPTNGTLLFFKTDSTCLTLNKTINDSGIIENFMDEYKTWHDGPIDNYEYNSQKLNYDLSTDTVYYFKVKVCDPTGNCASSACTNFTTKASFSKLNCPTCSSKLKFDFTATTGVATSDLAGNMRLEGDFTGNDDVYETSMDDDCGCSSATYINFTNLQNFSLKYTNPNTTKEWGLVLKDATAKKGTLSNVISNITGEDFIIEDTMTTTGDVVTFVGIDDEKWNKIKTEVSIDYVDINLPGNYQEALWHCDEDLANCMEVTDDATLMGYNTSDDFTTWRVPANLYEKVGM